MITIGAREAKDGFSDVLENAQHDEVVITKHGKPIAIIRGVAGMELEDIHWATDDDLQRQLQRARTPGRRKIPHDEVKRRLGLR